MAGAPDRALVCRAPEDQNVNAADPHADARDLALLCRDSSLALAVWPGCGAARGNDRGPSGAGVAWPGWGNPYRPVRRCPAVDAR
jgi:hypothetical protein